MRERIEGERVVSSRRSAQESFQCGLLDSGNERALKSLILELVHLREQSDCEDVLEGLLPVALVELFGCVDNVVSVVLGGELEGLRVVLLDQLLEGARDDTLVYQVLILSDVRDL